MTLENAQNENSDQPLPLPPEAHPLRKLGQRLTELLDEDHWAECERLLLEGWIKSEEHKCCAEDLIELRAAANALLHQIDIGDFTDSNGHAAQMLKATHDLMRVLGA